MSESVVHASTGIVIDLREKEHIRVLHVDDEECLLKVAKECLQTEGPFEVETALSVEEAMEKLEGGKFDVVVSDYQMPGKDGLAFLKELRDRKEYIPFIMFTGRGKEEVAIKALNYGADRYLNKSGDPETVYGELAHSIRKAVERKRAMEALKESEERYRNLLESISDSVYLLDREWRHLIVNDATTRLVNMPKDKLLGSRLTELFPSIEKTDFFKTFRRVMETRKPDVVADEYMFPAGGKGWCEIHVYPVKEGILCISTDITERKKMEDALKNGEKKYRQLVESLHEGIWVIDRDAYTTFVNPRMAEMLGYTVDEMQGKHLFSFMDKRGVEICKNYLERRKQGIKEQHYFEFIRKDGTRVYARLGTSPITDDYGNYVGALASVMDITEQRQAEDKLRESEEKWRSLVEMAPDGIATIDMKGVVTSVNNAFLRLTEYSREEIVGKHFTKLQTVRAKDIPKYLKLMVSALRGKTPKPFEYSYVRKNGTIGWGEAHIGFMKKNGKTIGYQAFFREITERKQTEQKLGESEKELQDSLSKLNLILSTLNEGVNIVTYDYTIRYQNKFLRDRFGDVTGKKCYVEYIGLDKPCSSCPMRKAIRHKKTFRVELTGKDGRNYEIVSMPLKHSDGHIDGLEIVRDISERKRAEQKILESQRSFERLFMDNPEAAAYLDLDFRILDVNPRFSKLFGYSSDEIKDKHIDDLIVPDNRIEEAKIFNNRASKGKAYQEDTVRKKKDGTLVPVSLSAAPITVENKIIGHVAIYKDISQLKNTEKMIRESHEKFTRLFMDNPEAAVYLDADFHIVNANPRFIELFGYSLDELVHRHINGLIVPNDKIEEGEMLDKKASKGYVYYDTVRKRKDGSLVSVSISAAPITVEGRPVGTIELYRDVTERKRFEERLSTLHTYSQTLNMAKSKKEIYRLALDAIEKTLGFEIAFFMAVNKNMLRVVDHRGYPRFFSMELPLDGTKRGVSAKVARTGKSINVPDSKKNNDWVEFMPGIRSGLDVPVKTGGRVLGVIGVDSKELAAFDERDQKLLEILASHAATAMSNLNYAKNLERLVQERTKKLKKTQEHLLKAERLAAIGEIAAMVGHDLRNPLTGISGATYYLKKKLGSKVDQKTREMFEIIEKDIEHSNNIINDLLEYSREIRVDLRETDPKSIIKDALSTVSIPGNVRVRDLTQNKPQVKADLEKMKRVFVNIIRNAIDAMPKGGGLTITSKESHGNLEIAFTDTGVGIPEDVMRQLWTPLFTTKANGMGLGLCICRRVVEAHGGRISVESAVGKGTTFTVIVPILGVKRV